MIRNQPFVAAGLLALITQCSGNVSPPRAAAPLARPPTVASAAIRADEKPAAAPPADSSASPAVAPPAPAPSDLLTGWGIQSADRKSYRVAGDIAVTKSGKASARLEWTGGEQKFGYLAQAASAEPYRGKRLRFSASVKSDGLTEWAAIWLRLDGGPRKWKYQDLRDKPVRGTTDWTRQEIAVDVEPSDTGLHFGLTLWGKGRAWIDDVKLEIVPAAPAPTGPPPIANGDFEAPGDAVDGWSVSGGGRDDYEAVIDRVMKHGGGASARLSPRGPEVSGYGALATHVDALRWRGKRVRMEAFVRGEGVGGRGDLWLRVQAAESPGDGPGLGGGTCSLNASFDWKPCRIVFDVPNEGDQIQMGIGLDGPGTLWLDDVKLDVVGKSVPLRTGLEAARNLDFEE